MSYILGMPNAATATQPLPANDRPARRGTRRNFDAVFEVAAALISGRILHADTAPSDAATWGVICCDEALSAFDPRSEAWVGRDGIPARFTFEEADLRARRMTGSSHGLATYSALEIPSHAARVTAGPVARSGSAPGSSFGCVDWTSGPGVDVQLSDDSAFGAAMAFVGLVGVESACAAVWS